MKLVRSFISLVVAALAILFALGNRNAVSVTYSPIHDPVTMPVFVLALSAVVIGFVAGGIIVWLNEASIRADRRQQRKIIRVLEEKLVEEDDGRKNNAGPIAGLFIHNRDREETGEGKRL